MKRAIFTAALIGGFALPLMGAASPLTLGVQDSGKPEAKKAAEDPAVTLSAEYEAALAKYKQELRDADRKERRAIRDNHPIKEFWPRFEELGTNNNGRALLWMANNVKQNKAIKKDQRAKTLEPIYAALVEHHAGAEWFGDALKSLASNAKTFEPAKVAELFESVVEKADSDNVKALALVNGAKALKKSDPEKSAALMARVIKEFPDTHHYTAAKALEVSESDIQVGKVAPDFYGETIDGFGFHLEDYRGKVVALDFYGFW